MGLRALKTHFALPQKCSIEKVLFPTSPCADTDLSAHVASLYPSCMVLLLEPYAVTLRSMVLQTVDTLPPLWSLPFVPGSVLVLRWVCSPGRVPCWRSWHVAALWADPGNLECSCPAHLFLLFSMPCAWAPVTSCPGPALDPPTSHLLPCSWWGGQKTESIHLVCSQWGPLWKSCWGSPGSWLEVSQTLSAYLGLCMFSLSRRELSFHCSSIT